MVELTTWSASRKIALQMNGWMTDLTIPADPLATLTWK